MQFLLGVRVMWKKINVFVLSLFRSDFVIIFIIIIIQINCFLIKMMF